MVGTYPLLESGEPFLRGDLPICHVDRVDVAYHGVEFLPWLIVPLGAIWEGAGEQGFGVRVGVRVGGCSLTLWEIWGGSGRAPRLFGLVLG